MMMIYSRYMHLFNKYDCTIGQELTGASAYARDRNFDFTHYVAAQHFPTGSK